MRIFSRRREQGEIMFKLNKSFSVGVSPGGGIALQQAFFQGKNSIYGLQNHIL
jgi:hypothetical protein